MSECREEHEGRGAISPEMSEPGRADLAERHLVAGSEVCGRRRLSPPLTVPDWMRRPDTDLVRPEVVAQIHFAWQVELL
jgi:hypothetical protein